MIRSHPNKAVDIVTINLRETECLSQAIETDLYSAAIVQDYAAAACAMFLCAP